MAFPFGKPQSGYTYTGGFTVTFGSSTWPALPDAVISLPLVSNGCGGGKAGEYGIVQRLGNVSTFLETNNPLRKRYTVSFKPACDLHDAGYSGAKVIDLLNGGRTIDFFEWSQKAVDDKFLADMRELCTRDIPASAPGALAACKGTAGGFTSLSARDRYNFVRERGHTFYRRRPNLNGVWAGVGVKVRITQHVRVVRGTWQEGNVNGEFRGTLISRDQDSIVEGFEHTSAKPGFASIKITVNPDDPDRLHVSGGTLGTLTR